jgi:hypothetical protein
MLNRITDRLDTVEEKIIELEVITIKTILKEMQKEKDKGNEQCISELHDMVQAP